MKMLKNEPRVQMGSQLLIKKKLTCRLWYVWKAIQAVQLSFPQQIPTKNKHLYLQQNGKCPNTVKRKKRKKRYGKGKEYSMSRVTFFRCDTFTCVIYSFSVYLSSKEKSNVAKFSFLLAWLRQGSGIESWKHTYFPSDIQ